LIETDSVSPSRPLERGLCESDLIAGPYCTGWVTSAGNSATFASPQCGHCLTSACVPSLRCGRAGGQTPGAFHNRGVRPPPEKPDSDGNGGLFESEVIRCTCTLSGRSTALSVCPVCPGCPPLGLPLGCRKLRGHGFRSPSLRTHRVRGRGFAAVAAVLRELVLHRLHPRCQRADQRKQFQDQGDHRGFALPVDRTYLFRSEPTGFEVSSIIVPTIAVP